MRVRSAKYVMSATSHVQVNITLEEYVFFRFFGMIIDCHTQDVPGTFQREYCQLQKPKRIMLTKVS